MCVTVACVSVLTQTLCMTFDTDVPLAPFTTFQIGGNARYMAYAHTVEDIYEALAFAQAHTLRVYVLGGGSNTLFDDSGFDGLVLKIEIPGIERIDNAEDKAICIVAGAGEHWDDLVSYTTMHGLWGLENLSGIPGVVGASPVQNIGAYGVEVSDVIMWVDAIDVQENIMRRFTRDECMFGYRTSIFKQHAGRYIVVRVAYELSRCGSAHTSYADIYTYFKTREVLEPTLSNMREAVLSIRASKFPDITREGTAGSFFMNPIVSSDKADRIEARLPGLPRFVQLHNMEKISLAYMLDKGLQLKGYAIGGARLFEKQPLVVVAQLHTSSQDVQTLMCAVQEKVREEYGIDIEPEVRIIT